MNGRWEELASRAKVAALVIAPHGGGQSPSRPEFELRYLDAEPDKAECRELSAKGWTPVLLMAWTSEGLRFEYDDSILTWSPFALVPFVRTACFTFLAAVNQRKPVDRARMN